MSAGPEDWLWFRALAGLAIGLTLGSFVTMLSWRLPRGLSVVRPRSHCPACKATLAPRDLVPLASWLWNRGRCRACGTRVSLRYPLIEAATAVPVGAAFVVFGFTGATLLAALAIVGIVSVVVISVERSSG